MPATPPPPDAENQDMVVTPLKPAWTVAADALSRLSSAVHLAPGLCMALPWTYIDIF